MKDHAAGVDDPPEPRRDNGAKPRLNLAHALVIRHRFRLPFPSDLLSNRIDHAITTELADKGRVRRLVDQRPNGRQG